MENNINPFGKTSGPRFLRRFVKHVTGAPFLARLLREKWGFSISPTYFALCFATLCRYVDLDFKKYESDPSSFILAPGWYQTTPIDSAVVDRFLKEISAPFDKFKAFLGQRPSARNDFTCFRGKPCLRDDANHLLVDPRFLAEKSESGVFWAVNQALNRDQRLQFHRDWGTAFERYVNWLMDVSVDSRLNKLYKNPKFLDNGEEVCDAILLCGDSVIFVESKAATFTAEAKYGVDPAKLRDEIQEKLIETDGRRKGIGQLAARIEQVFNRRNPRAIAGIDVSRVGKVYPVLITRDDVGSALVMNAYLASKFRELFHRKSVSATVTPPFSFSAQDIEVLCGYLHDVSFADLIEARLSPIQGGAIVSFRVSGWWTIPCLRNWGIETAKSCLEQCAIIPT